MPFGKFRRRSEYVFRQREAGGHARPAPVPWRMLAVRNKSRTHIPRRRPFFSLTQYYAGAPSPQIASICFPGRAPKICRNGFPDARFHQFDAKNEVNGVLTKLREITVARLLLFCTKAVQSLPAIMAPDRCAYAASRRGAGLAMSRSSLRLAARRQPCRSV